MNNNVMCAVIKVDINDNNPNLKYYDRIFEVPYNVNIEEVIEFIKETGKKYNIPISRVYLSGHSLSSPSTLMTREKIENFFKNSIKISNSESVVSMKR